MIIKNFDYNHTIVSNEIIYNGDYSWEELGIMVALLSFPEEKRVVIDDLLLKRPYKKKAMTKAIKELARAGLIRVVE